MEDENEQLEGIYLFFYRHWPSLIVIPYPLLIILDAYTIPSANDIYSGQPFLYFWYVDAGIHFWALMTIGVILFLFLIKRMFLVKSGPFRFVPPLLFIVIFFFSFVSFVSISRADSSASHLESAFLNQTKYNLDRVFYDRSFTEEYVLVKCDSLGLLCTFVEKWEHEVPFLSQSSAKLIADETQNTISVLIDGKVIYTNHLE